MYAIKEFRLHTIHSPQFLFKDLGSATYDVAMPAGARVLSVRENMSGALVVCAEVNLEAALVKHRFVVYGAGWETDFPRMGQFIGSVPYGDHPWHVFDHGEVE